MRVQFMKMNMDLFMQEIHRHNISTLPSDARVVRVTESSETGCVDLLIESAEFKDVKPGQCVPQCYPTFTRIETEQPEEKDAMRLPVSKLKLSNRASNMVLNRNGFSDRPIITHVYQLARMTEADLLSMRNVGIVTVNEIKTALKKLGLKLKKEE